MIRGIMPAFSSTVWKNLSFLFICLLFGNQAFGQSWKLRGSDITGNASSEEIGQSVSFSYDGKIIAFGAPGANYLKGLVRIYQWSGSSWSQRGSDINDTATSGALGYSVSLDSAGKTIAIGSPGAAAGFGQYSNSGLVKVYSWNGTSWTQKGGSINAKESGEGCGNTVSLSNDGNTIAIGSPSNAGGGISRGQVRIFQWNGSSWAQKGSGLNGDADYDLFGNSASLNATGNKLAIGAPFNSAVGSSSGRAKVYSWNGSSWVLQGGNVDGDSASDNFGYSVSLSKNGSRLAVGAPQDMLGGNGYCKIFDWNGTAWVQKGINITSGLNGDEFGHSVSISGNGNNVAIGARNSVPGNEKGRGEIYGWNSAAWTRMGDTIKGTEDYDGAGEAVGLNYAGDVFAIGAPSFNGTGSAMGSVRVFNFVGPCNTTYSSMTKIACGSYTWNSKNYTVSGIYKDTIPNAGGCDSIMTLNLTVSPVKIKNISAGICGSVPYTAPSGKKFNQVGLYTDTIKYRSGGCDSIIYAITLSLSKPNKDGFVLKDSTLTQIAEGAVAHGDIDKDGDEDILLTGKDNSGKIVAEMYTNDGTGTFTKLPGTPFTGAKSGSASVVDIDGDKLPEVFITGLDSTGKAIGNLYKNNGSGSFSLISVAPFNKLTGTIHAFADFDNDNDQDLLISSGDSVLLYKNTSGTFSATPVVVTNSSASYGFLLTRDLNGDGFADIIKSGTDVATGALPTQLLMNDKTGNSFTLKPSPFESLTVASGAIADFNGDGKPDFIMNGLRKNFNVITRIYSNDGNGNFSVADSTSIKGFFYGSTLAEDFNADGKQDILICGNADFSGPQVRMYVKDNAGKFVIPSDLPVTPLQMSAATLFDMDGDGLKDLLITGQDNGQKSVSKVYKTKGCFAPCETQSEITVKFCGPYTSPSGKYVWTESGTYTDVLKGGNKAGCDSTIIIHLRTSSFSSVAMVACDSFIAPSGKIIRSSGQYNDTLKGRNQWGCDSVISIDLNISSPVPSVHSIFVPGTSVLAEPHAGSISIGDVTGDGKNDILLCGANWGNGVTTKLYENKGNGVFQEMTSANLVGAYAGATEIGDVVGDSKPDIIISGYIGGNLNRRTVLYENKGGGVFQEVTGTPFPGITSSAIKIMDLVGDSKNDILISGDADGNYITRLYENKGNGVFQEKTSTGLPDVCVTTLSFADAVGDGKPDLLITGYNGSRQAKLFENKGNGTFQEITSTGFIQLSHGSALMADLVGDSKPDVFISGFDNNNQPITRLYENKGGGVFQPVLFELFYFVQSFNTVAADLVGDSKIDLIVSGHFGSNSVTFLYENKGGGVFDLVYSPGFNTSEYHPYIETADLLGDSKVDLAMMPVIYENKNYSVSGSCISVTGCNTYTSPTGKYTWTKSGDYRDTIHLASHDSVITVNLLIDSVKAQFTQQPDPSGKYAALIVNKSKGQGMSFVWRFGDGDSSTANTPTHTYAAAGTYHLCLVVKTRKGCTDTYCQDLVFHDKNSNGTFSISVIDSIDGTLATGIEDKDPLADGNSLSFSVFPNPTSHSLNLVNNEHGSFDVTVRDLSGREVGYLKEQQDISVLDMSALTGGMYIIEIRSKNSVGYYKVLKQ